MLTAAPANPSFLTGQPESYSVTVASTQTSVVPGGHVVLLHECDCEQPWNLPGHTTLDANGDATFSTTHPRHRQRHDHRLYNFYGIGNFGSSTSAALAQTISQAPTTTTLTAAAANPSSPSYGQSLSYSVTVAATQTTLVPGGHVVFYMNATASSPGTYLGYATLDANGDATFSTSALAVGSDTITAIYNFYGIGNFASSTSAATRPTVTQAPDHDHADRGGGQSQLRQSRPVAVLQCHRGGRADLRWSPGATSSST